MAENTQLQEYATTIALPVSIEAGETLAGIMLRGPSASGKSDLALRMIDQGAHLVADDQTYLTLDGGQVMASSPENLAGKLEVRGLGILKVPYQVTCPLSLVVDLKPLPEIERLPEQTRVTYLGQDLPLIQLCAFEISAVTKLKLALKGDFMDLDQ